MVVFVDEVPKKLFYLFNHANVRNYYELVCCMQKTVYLELPH